MKKNYAIFALIASSIFVISGAIILFALTSYGPLNLQGVALGSGFGLWVVTVYLVGRKIYGTKKNLLGLIVFMLIALAIGLIYHFYYRKPYLVDHRNLVGVCEQLCGIAWICGFAAIYLAYQDYRRASE